MHLSDLSKSTYFRFGFLLTAAFLTAYLIAGSVAFSTINADLDKNIQQTTELIAERLEDEYQEQGANALIKSVQSRTDEVETEDEFYWLGTKSGTMVAGSPLVSPLKFESGAIKGDRVRNLAGQFLKNEDSFRFHIAVRELGNYKLIVAVSYEEAVEIRNSVIVSFALATGLMILLAVVSAFHLARQGQKRLNSIASTMDLVSSGNMSARIPLEERHDDLTQLSTQINDALDKLEKTVHGIRQVSIDIAHDLRTPINRLSIHLEKLYDDAAGNLQLENKIDAANADVKQIANTFDALLRIAQIEAGARKARFEKVSLFEIANSLLEAFVPVAEENNQRIILSSGVIDDAHVLGDRDLLLQLYANLIENAVRHCPEHTIIEIAVGKTTNEVWMSVKDNGPGIPENERQFVLERFYRLDKSRHTKGSGLGLALVKSICELHGASLSLEGANSGLIVLVTFPILDNGGR